MPDHVDTLDLRYWFVTIGMKEYNTILVVVDHYTKLAKFIPTTTNIIALEFATLFHESIELQFGSP
jgi:hypothetical protein